jgi:hypothetical protein
LQPRPPKLNRAVERAEQANTGEIYMVTICSPEIAG